MGVGPADPAGTRDQPGTLDEGGAAEQTVDLDRPDPPTRSDPGAPTRGHDTDEVGRAEPADTSHTPFTQQVGRVVLVLLAVLFGVFAVANSQRVDFSWVFGATEVQRNSAGEVVSGGVPLIVLLIVSLVIGIAVGMLTMWLLHRRRR